MSHLLAFVGLAAVVIVTPGPDTALTVRNTLAAGRRGGMLTALGVASGQAAWTLAASAGIAAAVAASQPLFLALRIGGAAYLVWLGLGSLRAARHDRSPGNRLLLGRNGRGNGYRQGLLSNLGNPKMVVFFTSLLPQFAGRGVGFVPLLAFGLLFCGLTLAWLSAYALAVARAHDVLLRTRVRRALDAVTGAALVGLGLRLASEARR